MSYMARYCSGEHVEVWAEIRHLKMGELDERTLVDCFNVAVESIRRANYNLTILYARLVACDYEFYDFIFQRPLGANDVLIAAGNAGPLVLEIESKLGLLPLSLRAWLKMSGGVNFTGQFQCEKAYSHREYTDPIVLIGAEGMLGEMEFEIKEHGNLEGFLPSMAPDKYIKVGEGGGPSCARLADGTVDFIVGMESDVYFIDYLRSAFEWGGFPGVAQLPASHELRIKIEALKAGLLPI